MSQDQKHQKHADKVKTGSPEPMVIFVASSTPEKVFNLKRIAESKGYPIVFEDSNKLLGAFNHVEEPNGNYVDNAKDKLGSIDIQGFRDAANNDDDRARREFKERYPERSDKDAEKYIEQVINYRKRLANYRKDRDLPETTKMFFASEDGGFALPKEIWKKIKEKHNDGIPDEVLAKIQPDSKHPEFTGPGSETAPVLSAVLGEYNFMQRVQNAIAELGKNGHDVPILQNSVMHLEEFSKGSNNERIVLEADKTTHLHTPDKSLMNEIFTKNSKKITTYDYSSPTAESKESIIAQGEVGIIENGVRALLIDQIYDKFLKKEKDSGYTPSYDHPYKDIVNKKHIYRIGAFGTGDALKIVEEINSFHKKLGDGFAPSIPTGAYIGKKYGNDAQILQGTNYDILSNIELTLANADSIILFPDMQIHNGNGKAKMQDESEKEKLAQLMKIYTLSSLVVDKQLNARDANKPIIIMNHDGSWNDAIAIHNNLSNIGMTKDYSIYLPNKNADEKDVNIQSNSYFDVLGTPKDGGTTYTYEQTAAAVLELLKEKRKGYNPRTPSQSDPKKSGVAPRKSDYKVALFCSASSENEYLNKSIKEMSYNLAKEEFSIIYGGGDRYTMGAVLDGVMQRRKELIATKGLSEEKAKAKTYIAGYSTKQILKAETKYSAFSSDLNYAKQNENIYQRMADMLKNSDVVVAAPGGAGTVQEWTAALILNHSNPPEDKKPIVFYNPKLNVEQTQVWNVALKAVLGEKDYNLLTSETSSPSKREGRSKELGIYVETTESGVQRRISELRKEHELHKKHSHVESFLSRSSHADGITLH
jgi:predicted Rossmann-fold nucleotide-binding protein